MFGFVRFKAVIGGERFHAAILGAFIRLVTCKVSFLNNEKKIDDDNNNGFNNNNFDCDNDGDNDNKFFKIINLIMIMIK